MFEFASCWERIKSKTAIKKHIQLAEILNVYPSLVSKNKKKNVFPVVWAETIGDKFGLSPVWIMTGEGQATSNASQGKIGHSEDDQGGDDIERYVECYWGDEFVKKVPLIKGALYEVDPINPKTKKMKGEKVLMIDTGYMGPATCLRIDSQWHSKKRNYTEFDPCDLKLLSKTPDLSNLGIDV